MFESRTALSISFLGLTTADFSTRKVIRHKIRSAVFKHFKFQGRRLTEQGRRPCEARRPCLPGWLTGSVSLRTAQLLSYLVDLATLQLRYSYAAAALQLRCSYAAATSGISSLITVNGNG